MTWLARTPICVVQACLTMMPRLQANDSITRINETMAAFGTADRESTMRLRLQLESPLADAPGPPSTPPRRDPEELRQRGFKVRRVKRARRTPS